eukprot:GSChrysophyteH1.ASY1.ANO1.193.1 assembled CDS
MKNWGTPFQRRSSTRGHFLVPSANKKTEIRIGMSATIRLTPLMGGQEDGGVCSLLEIGGARVLLDCGCTLSTGNEELLKVAAKLREGGGVDCILLSHADLHHIGALPVIFGAHGLKPVPVVCTLPVAKFAMLTLYDLQLNIAMEGVPNNANAADNAADAMKPMFSLDDIDACLANVTSTKYSQQIPLSFLSAALQDDNREVNFCAYNTGRTIGGAAWEIRHGATSVLYAVDVNLKKEVVLNATALDSLPLAPELLIVEGGCMRRKILKTNKRSTKSISDGKAGAAVASADAELFSLVDETLLKMGNVLIPCESCARVLEALQLLARHWVDSRKAFDHLVFLSPMSFNLIELARSQLEWMTDSLSDRFYNGQANPFELPQLKIATTIRELEKNYPGPKVVLATDASLQCGTAKELLLRWGGNPLNRVIFLDTPDKDTLASSVIEKSQNPPIVLQVSQPQRVELVGEELAAFIEGQQLRRRMREEAVQKKIRESELAALSGDGGDVANTQQSAASESDMEVVDADASNENRRGQASRIAKFAQPLFPLFETVEHVLPSDEYGQAIFDLQLRLDEAPQGTASTTALTAASAAVAAAAAAAASNKAAAEAAEAEAESLPFKIMSSRVKVQFTCDFRSVPLGGRADLRAVKAIMTKLQPARVLVLRGSATDCEAVKNSVSSIGTLTSSSTYAPANDEFVEFSVRTDRVNLVIPSSMLPASEKKLKNENTGSVVLSAVRGMAQEVARSTSGAGAGVRRIRLTTTSADTAETALKSRSEGEGDDTEAATDEWGFGNLEEDGLAGGLLPESGDSVAVSLGEVSFNALFSALKAAGINTESMTASSTDGVVGTVLVCDKQVMVSRSGTNDFLVEGPPVSTYWAVRKVIYDHFAFLQ